MFIKHKRLKKLSLWGCSSLDVRFLINALSTKFSLNPSSFSQFRSFFTMQALFLNCPELKDLNLNLCSNLQAESLVLQCPKLQIVYASGCQGLLTGAIRKQVITWTKLQLVYHLQFSLIQSFFFFFGLRQIWFGLDILLEFRLVRFRLHVEPQTCVLLYYIQPKAYNNNLLDRFPRTLLLVKTICHGNAWPMLRRGYRLHICYTKR